MTTCAGNHTKFQPDDAQWLCPSCGCNSDHFIIDSPMENDCTLIHDEDEVSCSNCDGMWYGRDITATIAKKLNMVTCPACHGSGCISKEDVT